LGYIDKNLMEGEKVIAKAHLHTFIFFWPLILTLIVALIFRNIIIIIPLIWLGLVYWGYSSAEFAVTNRRIIAKWGSVSKHSVEMNLDKVEGVSINQGILGSRLGYGTVILNGTGGSKEHFPNIADPLAFRQKILEHTTQHLKENIPLEESGPNTESLPANT